MGQEFPSQGDKTKRAERRRGKKIRKAKKAGGAREKVERQK